LRVNFVRLVRSGEVLAAPSPEVFGIEPEPTELAVARPYAEPAAGEEPDATEESFEDEADAYEDEEWEEEDIEEGC
jgi:hypothetical protein